MLSRVLLCLLFATVCGGHTSGEGAVPEVVAGAPGEFSEASTGRFLTDGADPSVQVVDEISAFEAELGACGVEVREIGGEHALEQTFSFIMICVLLCTGLDWLNSWVPVRYRLPLSVVMFISGTVIGIILIDFLGESAHGYGVDHMVMGLQNAAWFAPHALFYCILPPLLYESSSNMSWHVLSKVLPSSLILAGPGVILNTLFTSIFVKFTMMIGDNAPSWEIAILLSAILSATDPVAVVAALKDLGAPEKLSHLVDGESLVNDASAVVCTYVALDWVTGNSAPVEEKYCPTTPPTIGCVLAYFSQVSFGGTGVGIFAGFFLYYWLGMVRKQHSSMLETTSILCVVYGTFFLSEAFHFSGVLATVCLGIMVTFMVRPQMSHEGRHALHTILEQICYICNQIVFFVAGVITVRFMWRNTGCGHDYQHGRAWGELAGLYVAVHVSRALMIAIFSPILKRLGYGINLKEFVFLVYGGLRGAIALVMGLIILENPHIDPEVKQMLAFHISGIVLLTLFINGLTVDNLYQWLEMYPEPAYKTTYMRNICERIEVEAAEKGVVSLSQHWFFSTVHFDKIIRCVPNFKHVLLDNKVHAIPIHLESVDVSLLSLGEEAELQHHLNQLSSPTSPSGDSAPAGAGRRKLKTSFVDRWLKRHSPCEEIFRDLLNRPSQVTSAKDTLEGLGFSAEGALELQDVEDGGYCSAKSLKEIGGQSENGVNLGFSVTIHTEHHVGITIGLLERPEDPARLRKYFRGKLQGSLHFIGLNCTNGTIIDSGPHGDSTAATQIGPVVVGDIVRLEVVIARGLASHFVVTVQRGSEGHQVQTHAHTLQSESVGLEKLFPAVRFHQEHAHGSSSDFISETNSEVSGVEHNDEPSTHSGLEHSTHSGLEGHAATTPTHTSEVHRGTSNAKFLARQATSALTGNFFTRRASHARVILSYQPQLATDKESINGMFRVLFNTVKGSYAHMFEHGLLGGQAYYWLRNSADHAMDCANNEVNAKRFMDFARDKKDPTLQHLQNRKWKPAICSGEETGDADEQEAILLEILEPLLVEYLSIDKVLGQSYFFERIADRWHSFSLRGYGFSDTNSKIETLWAFIETHQDMLKSTMHIDRFPLVVQCLERLISLAKSDLSILEELQPTRFFYGKHGLALRILLNKRSEKLKKVISQGWLSQGDAEGFVKEFQLRITEANNFHPRKAFICGCARRASRLTKGSDINAWDGSNFEHRGDTKDLVGSKHTA